MARLITIGFKRRVPFIPQMEMAECGAACLSMVLAYHRHHLSLFEARTACGVSRDGANAYSLAKAAEARGLSVQALKVMDAAGLADVQLPAIVHLRERHFVVLERVSKSHAYVVDPAAGRAKVPLSEFYESSSGVILVFAATPRLTPRPRPPGSGAMYARATLRYAPSMTMIIVATLAIELTGMLFPMASQVLIDFVIKPKQEAWLWILCGVLAAVTALRLVLLYLRDAVMHVATQLLDLRFMTGFVDRMLKLPIAFFFHRTTGDLMSRVSSNLALRGLSSQLIQATLDVVVFFAYAALMFAYDVRLGLAVVVMSFARLGVVAGLQGRGGEAALTERTRRGRESSALVQAFSIPELTKLASVRDHVVETYTERLNARLNAALERRRITQGTAQLAIVVNGLLQASLFCLGGVEVFAERISIGVFAAFLMMDSLLQRPLESIYGMVTQFGYLRSALRRTDDVFETPPEQSGNRDPETLGSRVTLEKVTFRHGHQGPKVIDDVSFDVREGEKIAIVGRSGAGKSTLARLMIGLLQPSSGVVRIGGADLREIDLQKLRARMGIVSQETFLFNDTIRNNLSLKSPDVPLSEIRRAARLACIDDVIEALPQGYETVVGQRAHTLSGGQRQRLSIARALIGRPTILLLDEATSALDLETESRVHANLASLDCTRIVVAHRLATVRDADRILVMDEGRIIQEGPYVALSHHVGIFRDMVETLGATA